MVRAGILVRFKHVPIINDLRKKVHRLFVVFFISCYIFQLFCKIEGDAHPQRSLNIQFLSKLPLDSYEKLAKIGFSLS